MTYIVIWGATAILSGVAGFFLASAKNRDASAWAAWCFLLPPLVIALLLTPRNTGPAPQPKKLDDLDREVF